MPSLPDNISTAVFFDPIARRIAKIYLDTKHLTGRIYISLRSIIESGGGRITPIKEAASIWIVDPDAPNALGDPPHNITEPSLPPLAYPEPEPTPAPKTKSFPVRNPVPFPPEQPINRSQNTELDASRWTSAETSEAFKYPGIVPPIPVWNIDLTGCPNPPHTHLLDPPNAGGKRTYSDKELTWVVDTIQWCLDKYPDMTLNTVCNVLARKGSHRTAEAYNSRIRRYLQWFADRSPLLTERLREYDDNITAPVEGSDTGSPPPAPQTATPDAQGHHWVSRGFTTDPKSTRFTDADRSAFIRFAAARPSGMEPTGMERSIDVWAQLARMHPHHSASSWRTWHQHWQHDLKQAVEEYRKANPWY
ncbi:hypothetical protein FRC11_000046 [Ceratobasidium sp. 423]|nr:hypothetical protein FRC11_000046 [Ceratobasidium sp. 423]